MLIDIFGNVLAGCACIIVLCVTVATVAFTITVMRGLFEE